MTFVGALLVGLTLALSLAGYVSGAAFWSSVATGAFLFVVGLLVLIVEFLTAFWSKAQTSLVDGLQAG